MARRKATFAQALRDGITQVHDDKATADQRHEGIAPAIETATTFSRVLDTCLHVLRSRRRIVWSALPDIVPHAQQSLTPFRGFPE